MSAPFLGLWRAGENNVGESNGPFITGPVLQSRQQIRYFIAGIQISYQRAAVGYCHHNENVPERQIKQNMHNDILLSVTVNGLSAISTLSGAYPGLIDCF